MTLVIDACCQLLLDNLMASAKSSPDALTSMIAELWPMKFIGFLTYLVLPFFLHKLSPPLSHVFGMTTDVITFYLYCAYFSIPYLVISAFPWLDICVKKARNVIRRHAFRYYGAKFSSENDPYIILGVDVAATNEDIKRAFHDIMKKYHPDKVEGMSDATKTFSMEMTKKANIAFSKIRKERGF